MSFKHNPSILKYFKSLPNKKLAFHDFAQKHFQKQLDAMLAKSMEQFHYPKFKIALALGANPNIDASSKVGYHLVTRCARSGEADFLETLLEFGGDVEGGTDPGGYTPMHIAAAKGMEQSIKVLAKYKGDIKAVFELNDIDKDSIYPLGWTPLICACIQNKTDAGKTLIDLGADPFDTNEKGLSALDICLKLKNKELADYIKTKQL